MGKIYTRLGDGTAIELSEKELAQDLENGTSDAAERGKIPPLTQEELKKLHGICTYDGVRLAGLYPHEQVRLAENAGATIFGPVVNTTTNKSVPENIARAVTFIKACVAATKLPVHTNMGMGVGAVPMCDILPTDAVSMASKAMVEITRLDGL